MMAQGGELLKSYPIDEVGSMGIFWVLKNHRQPWLGGGMSCNVKDVLVKSGCQRRQYLKYDFTSMVASPITLCQVVGNAFTTNYNV